MYIWFKRNDLNNKQNHIFIQANRAFFNLDQKISLMEFEEKRDDVFSKNTCAINAS